METVRPQSNQEQHAYLGGPSGLPPRETCQHPSSGKIKKNGGQPQEMLLPSRQPEPNVEHQIVERRMLVLAGAAQIKINRVGNGLRRAVNDGAFIVDFGEPPIGQEQGRAKQRQNYELRATGAYPPPPIF